MKKHTTKTASQGHKEMHFLPHGFLKIHGGKKRNKQYQEGKKPYVINEKGNC